MQHPQDPVKPYRSPDSKKEQVGRMFDTIAPVYDLMNRILSLGIDKRWRKTMISRLAPGEGHYLDLATGTGDVAMAIARMYPKSRVTGIDISREMLAIGRKKVTRQHLESRVVLVDGDAENLPFEGNTFSGATVAFGVRNFENMDRGLAEIHRVLKTGALFLVLEFSRPKLPVFKQLYFFYFRFVLPLIGRLGSKDPSAYRYLFESVQRFPEGEQFLEVLRKTGFSQAACKPLTFGICTLYSCVK